MEVLDAVVHRRQAEHPLVNGLGIFQVLLPGHKFRQMPVTRGGNLPVAAEQVKFDAVRARKGIIHPVVVGLVAESRFIVFFAEFAVQREQIHAVIRGAADPGEVVDSRNADVNILPFGSFDPLHVFQHQGQQALGPEYLVAAAERLDLREDFVQRADADRHGVGVVDDPRIGAAVPDRFGKLHVHGDGAHGPHKAARPHTVAHGLIDPEFFRLMHVGAHFLECPRKNGDHDEIRARQGFAQGADCLVVPLSLGVAPCRQGVPDGLVVFRRFTVNVIQAEGPAKLRFHGKVGHERPGPPAGAAADVGNLDVFYR